MSLPVLVNDMTRNKVLFPLTGKNYEGILIVELKLAGYEVVEVSEDEEFEVLYSDLCISTEGQFNLIIDIENASVEYILQSEYIDNKPKIIILTTLLTWCGGSSTYVVKNATYDFSTRIPLYSAIKAYNLENRLWNMATAHPISDTNGGIFFVGAGLLYGESGYDFEPSLRKYWDENQVQKSSLRLPYIKINTEKDKKDINSSDSTLDINDDNDHKTNNTLATHIKEFISGLIFVLSNDTNPSPSFFTLVDRIKNENLKKILNRSENEKNENEKNDKNESHVEDNDGDNNCLHEESESKLSSKCLVEQLPNTVSVSFKGILGYELMPLLLPKVACSAGSACHSNAQAMSSVLTAMGVPLEYGMGTLRLSWGRHTTENEIDRAVDSIVQCINHILSTQKL